MTYFFKLTGTSADEKSSVLRRAVGSVNNIGTGTDQTIIFSIDPSAFARVPKSPFAYWASTSIFNCFRDLQRLESPTRHAAAGAQTRDNLRFVRAHWEVEQSTITPVGSVSGSWVPLTKGGSHRRFYADVYLLVKWSNDGHELKAATSAWRASKGWGDYWRAAINSIEYYGKPGITWPVRSQKGFSARALGRGAIFGHKGPTVFVENESTSEMAALLALMNSDAFYRLVSLQMAFGAYEVGVIQNTPIPNLTADMQERLAHFALRAWHLERHLDATRETSHAFVLPSALYTRVTGVDLSALGPDLNDLQRAIDDISTEVYGLASELNADVTQKADHEAVEREVLERGDDDDQDEDASEDGIVVDQEEGLASWLVGTAFGRFDPRIATGERAPPPEPEPFGPLPLRSPGMWLEEERTAHRVDILVDDEGHTDDLASSVRKIAQQVFVNVPEEFRTWLAKEFFALHIKMYSKSRRKAPIYWQLAVPSARYSVWLYIHAFSKDTLYRIQTDYVAPKLAHETRALEVLKREIGDIGSGAQRKWLASQELFVEELRGFLEEFKRVTPLWNPDLDDGVVINFAPLWRLVPQHKSWQKEVKATWDTLCEGKYDWAHLAMHLWPERVVPKCATDRSLAIAHDLEDVFWVEGGDAKWKARPIPKRPIAELVAERTSEAVKAALRNLLDAPDPSSAPKRGRKAARA